jgi:hypothetical protein
VRHQARHDGNGTPAAVPQLALLGFPVLGLRSCVGGGGGVDPPSAGGRFVYRRRLGSGCMWSLCDVSVFCGELVRIANAHPLCMLMRPHFCHRSTGSLGVACVALCPVSVLVGTRERAPNFGYFQAMRCSRHGYVAVLGSNVDSDTVCRFYESSKSICVDMCNTDLRDSSISKSLFHTLLSHACDSLVFYRNKHLFSAGAAARLRLSPRSIQMIQLNSVARAVARGGRL